MLLENYKAGQVRRELVRCEVCQGAGRSMGIFHLLDCAACDGVGLVDAETCQALEPRDMVAQLLLRLAEYEQPKKRAAGPEADCEGPSNRKGAGASHWTGD